MSEIVVIRRISDSAQADAILDRLEAITGLYGERIEGGRRYDLTGSRDWLIAIASIRAQLAEIASDWEHHLDLRFEAG